MLVVLAGTSCGSQTRTGTLVDVNAPLRPWSGSANASQSDASARPASAVGPTREADLLVSASRPLSAAEVATIAGAAGVQAVQPVALGQVALAGHLVGAIGADPALLRQWTPTVSRQSDPLWDTVAAGAFATNQDLSHDLALPLGSTQQVATVPLRLGALAAMGIPGYDVTVSSAVGQQLHLVDGAGLLVSAPTADLTSLRSRLAAATPIGVNVALLRPSAPAAVSPGSFLTNAQITAMLAAATAQTGKPYVWGATGPDSFDCSGLVGFAFAAIGVALPRTSQQLWLSGPRVAPSQAERGDLLFWSNDPANPDDIDHVAIYLGNNLMISAPQTGAWVHITAVATRNFRGLVRPDPRQAVQVGGPMWASG